MPSARTGLHAVWTLIALLSVGVAGYAMFHAVTGFAYLPLQNPVLDPWGLQTHIIASSVALMIGPLQFLRVLRQRQPRLHRWLGRSYVAACLIGGFAGGIIALGSTAGPVAGWGFFLLALLWVPATLRALFAAMRRDFADHERWMIRSFALTLAAVTLRLYLPSSQIAGIPFPDAYPVIAWACWVPNLIIAEIWIASRRKPRPPVATAAA